MFWVIHKPKDYRGIKKKKKEDKNKKMKWDNDPNTVNQDDIKPIWNSAILATLC